MSKNSFSGYLWGLTRVFKGVQKKTGATVSNKDHIQQKNVFAATKIQKQAPKVFCKRRSVTLLLEIGSIITAKFLRTFILKNISVTNSEAVAQRSSVKKVFLEILQHSL